MEDLSLPVLEELEIICFAVVFSWVGWQWKEERDHRRNFVPPEFGSYLEMGD